jgi:hypothetical protein
MPSAVASTTLPSESEASSRRKTTGNAVRPSRLSPVRCGSAHTPAGRTRVSTIRVSTAFPRCPFVRRDASRAMLVVINNWSAGSRERVVSQSRSSAVVAAVKAIKDFHAIGEALPKKASHREVYDKGVIESAAAKLGINPDTVRKARQFADPAAGYSRAELNALCQLITKIQPGQDERYAVFGRTHVIRLLSVQKRWRTGLQATAIREGWSLAELQGQIAARYGNRRDGGRKRRVPTDALALTAQIEKLCENWRRWFSLAAPTKEATSDEAAGGRHVPLDGLPPALAEHIRATDAAIATLHRAATDELCARKPGRSVRRQFRPKDQ